MLRTLFLDIETIPAQRMDVLDEIREAEQAVLDASIAAIRPPGNYKKQETIDEWMATEAPKITNQLRADFAAKVDAAYRKTGLDGAFGQVFAIGVAIDNGHATVLTTEVIDPRFEAKLLSAFSEAIDRLIPAREHLQTCVVGHNISSFDLRFLAQRSIVHGIRPHTVIRRAAAAKPWESEVVYDTMTQWAGVGQRVSLDKLCRALRIASPKYDITGATVWDAVQAGRFADVAAYCKGDVEAVRQIHGRMTFESARRVPADQHAETIGG